MTPIRCALFALSLFCCLGPASGQTPGTLGPPPAPPKMVGGLQVIVNVPAAKVFLDGQFKGELTPPQVLNLADLPVGTVQVRVEAPGFQSRALNFTVQPGTWTQAVFVMVKQGGSTSVLPGKSGSPGSVPPSVVAKKDPGALPGAIKNAQGLWEVTVKVGSASIELIQLPPGKFRMGSAAGDLNEVPVHEVSIGKTIWIGKYPVTQKQWQAVIGYNPSKFKEAGPDAPVENVSWNSCGTFLNHLNEKQSEWTFRMPSEAEWEYACKAGSTGTRYGDTLASIAWYKDNSRGTTHPVGQKQPNAWGLYDMLGNVWQWCEDLQHDDYEGAPNDGTPWIAGSYSLYTGMGRVSMGHGRFRPTNVTRGGSWDSEAQELRASKRIMTPGDVSEKDLGFRIVGILK